MESTFPVWKGVDVRIEDKAVRGLIKWWCWESGVRGYRLRR